MTIQLQFLLHCISLFYQKCLSNSFSFLPSFYVHLLQGTLTQPNWGPALWPEPIHLGDHPPGIMPLDSSTLVVAAILLEFGLTKFQTKHWFGLQTVTTQLKLDHPSISHEVANLWSNLSMGIHFPSIKEQTQHLQ